MPEGELEAGVVVAAFEESDRLGVDPHLVGPGHREAVDGPAMVAALFIRPPSAAVGSDGPGGVASVLE